jgi:hypothetical protein
MIKANLAQRIDRADQANAFDATALEHEVDLADVVRRVVVAGLPAQGWGLDIGFSFVGRRVLRFYNGVVDTPTTFGNFSVPRSRRQPGDSYQ